MENIWTRAEELLAEGKPFVLATIIRTRGSVPREVGAKMVVPPQGQPFGTIGGGCGEGEVLRRAYPCSIRRWPRSHRSASILRATSSRIRFRSAAASWMSRSIYGNPSSTGTWPMRLAEAARERRPLPSSPRLRLAPASRQAARDLPSDRSGRANTHTGRADSTKPSSIPSPPPFLPVHPVVLR